MKVAFATKDGVRVNEHFGRCGLFAIYEVNEKGYRFLELRNFAEGRDAKIEETKGMEEIHDMAVWNKVKALSDCKIIYMTEIGPPSAARLSQKGIIPLKVKEETLIEECLERLADTIKTSPPPWFKKGLSGIKKEEET